MKPHKISIIVPTYNRNDILVKTLESIYSHCEDELKDCSYEIVIVDQSKSHTDKVQSYLKMFSQKPYVNYLLIEKANLPNARNVGINHSTGDIIVFLDDDVVLGDFYFSEMLNDYEDPEIDSVVGGVALVNKTGENLLLKNQSRVKNIIRKLLIRTIGRGKPFCITNFGFILSETDSQRRSIVDAGRGCNMSFRKSVFDKVGLFDSNYIGNALREETDFFCRLKSGKMKVLYNPKMRLDHVMENSGGCRNESNTTYWNTYFNNQCYFYRKNFNSSKLWIKTILIFDVLKCISNYIPVSKIIDDAYLRAERLITYQI